MKILTGKEEKKAIEYFNLAAEIAKTDAKCLKSKRGVVLVKNEKMISEGWNAPPEGEQECASCLRDSIDKKVNTEPCRAVHAEARAILNAYKNSHYDLTGSRMYHIKVKNDEINLSGNPSCTICSKLVLEAGISEFVLWQKEGVCIYDTREFNKLSLDSVLDYK